MPTNEIIVIGRFGRVHGIRGLITIHSYTEPRDNIISYQPWYAFINKQWHPIEVLDIESQAKQIVARVKGYPEREQVAALTQILIGASKEQLPALSEGEHYWHDLIGLSVVNLQDQSLGLVQEVIATGSNDVLVVEGEKRHLIPYLLGQFIHQINLEQKVIIVDWDLDF